MITEALLRRLDWIDPALWAEALAGPCQRHGINTDKRVAMFLANVGHESNGGRQLVESLNYTPGALLAQWPSRFTPEAAEACGRRPGRTADQRAIGNAAYGNRMGNNNPGDGWLHRGRGLLQVTGLDNYKMLATACKRAIEGLPSWLETRSGAAESAAAWWSWGGCNAMADAGEVARCRRKVNGGVNGLSDVQARYERAMAA